MSILVVVAIGGGSVIDTAKAMFDSCPRPLTLSSGADAICQCVESWWNVHATPDSRALAVMQILMQRTPAPGLDSLFAASGRCPTFAEGFYRLCEDVWRCTPYRIASATCLEKDSRRWPPGFTWNGSAINPCT